MYWCNGIYIFIYLENEYFKIDCCIKIRDFIVEMK